MICGCNEIVTKVPECFRAVQQHLKPFLESDAVVKVVHDCRLEAAVLLRCCLKTGDAVDQQPLGIRLAGVFDTAVAYSTILQRASCKYFAEVSQRWLPAVSCFLIG